MSSPPSLIRALFFSSSKVLQFPIFLQMSIEGSRLHNSREIISDIFFNQTILIFFLISPCENIYWILIRSTLIDNVI